MVPEDRVGADAALPVVDDGALVVRPQQDEVAVEREELVGGEALDLTVRDGCAVADDAAQVSFGREHAAHRERSLVRRDTVTASRSASYTASMHVSRVLAVDLQRERRVAAHDDAVEIASGERLSVLETGATQAMDEQPRKVPSSQAHGSDVREPLVEVAPGTRSSATAPA